MKTFITTILCIWASSTFALTSNESSTNRSEVKTVQQRHHKEKPSLYQQAMNKKDFQFLYKIIKKKSFDDDRMEILNVGVLDNYFTCQQCVQLMSLYKFDEDKLKILRIMAGHITDMENYEDILRHLDFELNKQKAFDILGIRHKRNKGRS